MTKCYTKCHEYVTFWYAKVYKIVKHKMVIKMSVWRKQTKRLSKWYEMSQKLLCFGLRKKQKYYKKCVYYEMLWIKNVMKCHILSQKYYILMCKGV